MTTLARPRRTPGWTAALVAVCAAGCVPAARGHVRTATGDLRETTLNDFQEAAFRRAARELACPFDALAVQSLGAGGYRVDGCAQTITYTCLRRERVLCMPSERTSSTEVRAEWSDDDVQRYFAAVHDRVVTCLPADEASLRLELAFTTRGGVRRTGRTPRDARVAACVDQALASETLRATARADRYEVLEFRRAEVGRVRAHIDPIEPTPPAAPTRAAIAPDAAARAVVDAQAAAILGCVEARAIALQLSWDRSGALDALLRDERRRDSDEPCVRAIVRGLRIPAPGSPGMITHRLQR